MSIGGLEDRECCEPRPIDLPVGRIEIESLQTQIPNGFEQGPYSTAAIADLAQTRDYLVHAPAAFTAGSSLIDASLMTAGWP